MRTNPRIQASCSFRSAVLRPCILRGKRDVLRHRAVRKQEKILEHHAYAAQIGRQRRHVGAADFHPATIGSLQAGYDAQERGLARPAGPQKREELARADLKAHAVDRPDRAEALLDRSIRRIAWSLIAPALRNATEWCQRPDGGTGREVRPLCAVLSRASGSGCFHRRPDALPLLRRGRRVGTGRGRELPRSR